MDKSPNRHLDGSLETLTRQIASETNRLVGDQGGRGAGVGGQIGHMGPIEKKGGQPLAAPPTREPTLEELLGAPPISNNPVIRPEVRAAEAGAAKRRNRAPADPPEPHTLTTPEALEHTGATAPTEVILPPLWEKPPSGMPSDYQRGTFAPMTKRQAKHAAFLARQQLTGKFTEDLMAVWAGQGPQILERAAFQNPMGFAKMVADLLPKQLDVDVSVVEELPDDQLAELIAGVGELLGRRVVQAAHAVEDRGREAGGAEPAGELPPVR